MPERSPSFVAIDLYSQQSSDYFSTSLLNGLIQVPILLCIHDIITVRKQASAYGVSFILISLQLLAITIYL